MTGSAGTAAIAQAQLRRAALSGVCSPSQASPGWLCRLVVGVPPKGTQILDTPTACSSWSRVFAARTARIASAAFAHRPSLAVTAGILWIQLVRRL